VRRWLKKGKAKGGDTPCGRCFVSYAYDDARAVERLESLIGRQASLFKFPPITVPPERMVSNDLIRAIRASDCLIYVQGGASGRSAWVTLERDYALRSGMDVYFFDARLDTIGRDDSAPLDLPVFPSYARSDGKRVKDLVDFMRRERSFDMFIDDEMALGAGVGDAVNRALFSRLERGGYVALFWTLAASKSEWVRSEAEAAFHSFADRIVPALVDPVDLPPMLRDVVPVRLYR